MKKTFMLLIVVIAGIAGFVFFSPIFEKEPPIINVYSNGFITNLRNPLKVEIKDNSGVKEYSVIAIAGKKVFDIKKSKNNALGKEVNLEVKLPNVTEKEIKLIIRAVDNSKWHFFAGNEAEKEIVLKIDTVAPDAQIIKNSYAVGRGGSGAVVVKVSDDNLKDKYIIVNNKYKFKLTPFVKDNYYAALIAWPVAENKFSADLIATDKAGNRVRVHIPFYWKTKGIYNPKNVKINITDKFINNIAKRVLERMGMPIPNDPVSVFKEVNEKVRKICEDRIYNYTKDVYENKIDSFSVSRFNPLPGSAKRADFGEIRHYYYKGSEISKAVHKGIDLAKIKRAKIYSSNFGKVIASEYIGIYGNTLIIYHKLGLYTLYGHTSEFRVKKGDIVKKGKVVARTGATGAVFGDHLHFGVYVQGIPVQPIEWMDSRWIKINIINVINGSKKVINK
ncbi:M23 family metallopeptidase [Caminibacter sp.]